MKTLIIHPSDTSTTFLTRIYSTVPDKTLVTKSYAYSAEIIDELVYTHDRVIAMGHGSSFGLFGFCKGGMDMYTVHALKHGADNVYIWCNADGFINKHKLTGFYTGMFISEVGEARACGLMKATLTDVTRSNNKFAEIMSRHINKPGMQMYKDVRREYGQVAMHNAVAAYNWNRLYYRSA